MADSNAPNNLAFLNRDRGYRFVDRDPVLVEVTDAITKSGKTVQWLEARSGVSAGTISNWLNGKTRRPQHITVTFVMRALGMESRWVKKEKELSEVAQPLSLQDAFPKLNMDKIGTFMKQPKASSGS